MKKLIFISLLFAVASSCHNADIVFDDYERQTIYFPIQYPVRTLSLGNDLVDNSLDKNHKFNIGVNVGGYYNRNQQDWHVDFVVDNGLVPDLHLLNNKGLTLKPLPTAYYTLRPEATAVIPEGSFTGLIEVQLSDDFFNDPRALTGEYVIPLRLTSSPDTENILHGTPASDAPSPPDIHLPAHWEVQPMDYTLFGIKYVNPYHGQWLRRGQMLTRNQAGAIVDTVIYHARYVEYNETVTLTSTSLHSVTSSMSVGTDNLILNLAVASDGAIAVATADNSPVKVSFGSGRYKENGDTWGGTPEQPTPRDAIYLNYFYNKTVNNQLYVCEVLDTLVFRDRGIRYEAENPTVVQP
ncbi:MAG: DUF5627 domain-containing protein [Bacteroidales bacterium]|jgi:hypothetical protein|nr:DUF5627 domain-containing protein [Bacteroidales bacterium]